MYGNIIGDPKSILRYKLNLNGLYLTDFSYRDSDKEFKIKTSAADVISKTSNIIIETKDKNNPIGYQFAHKLDFYKNIAKNNTDIKKAIKVKKNTTDEPISMELPFFENLSFDVPINPMQTGVLYNDSLVVYNSNTKRKVTEYHVISDGILELNEDMSVLSLISKTGEYKGYVECYGFINPTINLSRDVAVFNNLPTIVCKNDEKILVNYNQYGIIESITSSNDTNIKCVYNSHSEGANYSIKESVHHLLFDNFNYENYLDYKKASDDILKINIEENEVEYIQVIYDNVTEIQEVEFKDPEDLDFDNLVERYFNY